jgi:hypothetical protein
MARYARNQAILAKVETTYGTDVTPTGGSNAILVSNLSANPLNATNVDRSLIRNYLGGSEQLVGSNSIEVSFDVEFQNGGTAGTVAAWDPLLQACGYTAGSAQVTPSRVEHALESTYASWKSLTIYYHDDGVLHKLLGARGSVSLDLGVGNRPVFKFRFIGLNGGVSAAAQPSTTLTGFKAPLVVTDANTGALTLGCTYGAGVLSGGTEYVAGGMSINVGNDVQFVDLLGTATLAGQSIEFADRSMTGSIEFDLTAANEVSFTANVLANTTQAIGMVHGTTAGYKMLVFAPAVQLINPKKVERNGRRLIGYDMRILPSAGNDELKIVAL